MAVRKIITYPDPILRRKSVEVKDINQDVRRIVKDLIDTMNYYEHSVGISAPQIGENLRIICVDVSRSPHYKKKNHGLLVLINPVIVCENGEKVVREGCLSVPDFVGYVKRRRFITVKGITPQEEEVEIEAKHLEAVVIQHEIDHLDGILFIDRVDSPKNILKRVDLVKNRNA